MTIKDITLDPECPEAQRFAITLMSDETIDQQRATRLSGGDQEQIFETFMREHVKVCHRCRSHDEQKTREMEGRQHS